MGADRHRLEGRIVGAYEPGDRVRDNKWGGQFVGTVKRIFGDGDVGVHWDGSIVEDQMRPDEVKPELGDAR